MSARPFPSDLTTIEGELHSKWGWFVALGVVLVVLGILALGNLLLATLASVFFVGIMMILGTVAQVNSLWLLGLVLAIDLTFQGVSAIAFGLTLKAAR